MDHHPAPWSIAPEKPVLEEGFIHLWRFRLDLSITEIDQLQRLLSADERSRAKRLLDPHKSCNFIAARGRLRQILARYLDLDPETIQFSYGTGGKPSLGNQSPNRFLFNLAHSGAWAVLGVGKEHDLGVDIEAIDPKLAYEKIARQFFSKEELNRLSASDEHRRKRTFYRIWTRKEAWLKCQGWGFSGPLDQLTGGQPDQRWTTRNFPVDKGYIGALSFSDKVTSILRFNG